MGVHLVQEGGHLLLVLHAEDLDPGLGGPVVPGGEKGDRGRGQPAPVAFGFGRNGGHGQISSA